jgi:DNA anti-recombination protein RmuC
MAFTHARACAVQHAAYYVAAAITQFEEADKTLVKVTADYEAAFAALTRNREALIVAIEKLSADEEESE